MGKNVQDEHTVSFSCMKETNVKENGEVKMENMGVWQNGIRFWAFFLPRKLEHVFPKMGPLPNSNLVPMLFPLHALTNSTTFWQNLMTGGKRQNG